MKNIYCSEQPNWVSLFHDVTIRLNSPIIFRFSNGHVGIKPHASKAYQKTYGSWHSMIWRWYSHSHEPSTTSWIGCGTVGRYPIGGARQQLFPFQSRKTYISHITIVISRLSIHVVRFLHKGHGQLYHHHMRKQQPVAIGTAGIRRLEECVAHATSLYEIAWL